MAPQVWLLLVIAANSVLCEQETCKSITCSSRQFAYNECLLDPARPSLVTLVEVTKKESTSDCILDESFGIVPNGIYVAEGCRAIFNVCFEGVPPPTRPDYQETCKSITCSSRQFAYNECLLDPARPSLVTLVEVTKKESKSDCILDESFGIVPNGIYVAEGCRAIFNVCFFEERCRRIECSSIEFRKATCGVYVDFPVTVTRVEVVRKKSRSPCDEGIGFGIQGDEIFVDAGCRAIFNVCFIKESSCPFSLPDSCPTDDIFRTFDGTCNNLEVNPLWGSAKTPFGRFIPPVYKDGLDIPRDTGSFGERLPGPRLVSKSVHLASSDNDLLADVSHLTMVFGQFLAHDFAKNEEIRSENDEKIQCCPRSNEFGYREDACSLAITVPDNDPDFDQCLNFVRSVKVPNLECTNGPRQQKNHITSFIDLSAVYGSSEAEAEALRAFDGQMNTSVNEQGDVLLPLDVDNEAGCTLRNDQDLCFKAGDTRSNEHPLLASMHTVFVRLHNNIAADLLMRHTDFSDDDVYMTTRKILGAIMQHITYNEFLPVILGENAMDNNNLRSLPDGFFTDYNPTLDPSVVNSIAAAAFRFGHSMVPDGIRCVHADNTVSEVRYSAAFHKPDLFYDDDVGIESMTQGLIISKSQKVDRLVTTELTKRLFETAPGNGGDLIALNIQRGRDHGLPTYAVWRKFCGLNIPTEFTTDDYDGFNDLTVDVVRKLKELYSDPKDVDLYSAAVSEIHVPGGNVGPTFACMMGRQFHALKFGDRFWYENDGLQGFTKDQLNEIRRATMSGILCDTTDVEFIQPNAFRTSEVEGNAAVACSLIPVVDISLF